MPTEIGNLLEQVAASGRPRPDDSPIQRLAQAHAAKKRAKGLQARAAEGASVPTFRYGGVEVQQGSDQHLQLIDQRRQMAFEAQAADRAISRWSQIAENPDAPDVLRRRARQTLETNKSTASQLREQMEQIPGVMRMEAADRSSFGAFAAGVTYAIESDFKILGNLLGTEWTDQIEDRRYERQQMGQEYGFAANAGWFVGEMFLRPTSLALWVGGVLGVGGRIGKLGYETTKRGAMLSRPAATRFRGAGGTFVKKGTPGATPEGFKQSVVGTNHIVKNAHRLGQRAQRFGRQKLGLSNEWSRRLGQATSTTAREGFVGGVGVSTWMALDDFGETGDVSSAMYAGVAGAAYGTVLGPMAMGAFQVLGAGLRKAGALHQGVQEVREARRVLGLGRRETLTEERILGRYREQLPMVHPSVNEAATMDLLGQHWSAADRLLNEIGSGYGSRQMKANLGDQIKAHLDTLSPQRRAELQTDPVILERYLRLKANGVEAEFLGMKEMHLKFRVGGDVFNVDPRKVALDDKALQQVIKQGGKVEVLNKPKGLTEAPPVGPVEPPKGKTWEKQLEEVVGKKKGGAKPKQPSKFALLTDVPRPPGMKQFPFLFRRVTDKLEDIKANPPVVQRPPVKQGPAPPKPMAALPQKVAEQHATVRSPGPRGITYSFEFDSDIDKALWMVGAARAKDKRVYGLWQDEYRAVEAETLDFLHNGIGMSQQEIKVLSDIVRTQADNAASWTLHPEMGAPDWVKAFNQNNMAVPLRLPTQYKMSTRFAQREGLFSQSLTEPLEQLVADYPRIRPHGRYTEALPGLPQKPKVKGEHRMRADMEWQDNPSNTISKQLYSRYLAAREQPGRTFLGFASEMFTDQKIKDLFKETPNVPIYVEHRAKAAYATHFQSANAVVNPASSDPNSIIMNARYLQSPREFAKTLGHELTHARRYFRSNLEWSPNDQVRYRDRKQEIHAQGFERIIERRERELDQQRLQKGRT